MYLNIDVIIKLLMSTLLFIGIKAYIDDNNRNILYINPPPPFWFGKWKPYMRNILKKISVWTISISYFKSDLLVEETGKKHRPAASHWQT